MLGIFCATSVLATPEEDITLAVIAGGATSVEQASASVFTTAFTAVAARASARDLRANVAAAISLRPDLTARSVAIGIRAAVRGNSGSARAVVDRIIISAIALNPTAAVQIANAAVRACPAFRDTIAGAADSAAPPALRPALVKAMGNATRYANVHDRERDGERDGGPNERGTEGDDDVRSPEQPPRP